MASAARLLKTRGEDRDRLYFAEALISSDRPADALEHLRVLVSKGTPETEALYAEALSAAYKSGSPIQKELQTYWSRKLHEAGHDEEKQEEAAQVLLDLEAYETVLPTLAGLAHRTGGNWRFAYVETAAKANRNAELVEFLHTELNRTDLGETDKSIIFGLLREHGTDADALPYVRELAEARGGEWTFAYEEILQRLEKHTDLVAFWKLRAHLTTTPIEEKRGIAFRSLEAAEKDVAEEIFWSLASDEPAESSAVSQLLFVWGPRPRTAALDWIEMRAMASTGADKSAWVEHLINAGAAGRAVRVFKENEVSNAYFRALVAAGDTRRLAEAIERRVPGENDPDELRRLGQYAVGLNLPSAVRATYTKILSMEPGNPEALRRTGSLDYAEGLFAGAKDKLGRYLDTTRGDFESHFYYGELLQQEGNRAEARRHFEEALSQIEEADHPTFQMQAIHALTLHRVGKVDASFVEFENLIAAQPDNKHLRADYVSALIQSDRHNDAQRLLDEP